MAKYALNIVPNSETIDDGWEEVRGDWRVDSEGYIKVTGTTPSSPRWELSKVLFKEMNRRP